MEGKTTSLAKICMSLEHAWAEVRLLEELRKMEIPLPQVEGIVQNLESKQKSRYTYDSRRITESIMMEKLKDARKTL